MEPTLFVQMSMDEFHEFIKDAILNAFNSYEEVLKIKDNDKILSRNDVAAMLKISKATIRTWMKKRGFPHKRVGRRLIFSRNEIMDYLKETSKQERAGNGKSNLE